MKAAITVILVAAVFFPAAARPLSFYLKTAFEKSPHLRSQAFRAGAARRSYRGETFLPKNPILSFGYTNIPINRFPARDKHPMSGISIGLSQFISSPWEAIYRRKKFFKKYISEKESYNEAQNMLAYRVQAAFHGIMFLEKKRSVLKESRALLQNILRIAESLVAVNRMGGAQLLKIRGDSVGIDNRVRHVEGLLADAHALMEKLCGTALSWDGPDPELKSWIPKKAAAAPAADFNVQRHPLYKKLLAAYRSFSAARSLEIAKIAPGVTVGVEYRFRERVPADNPTSLYPKDKGEDFISLRASIPIPLYYPLKERHRIKAAQNREGEFRELLREIRISLESSWKGEREKYLKLKEAFRTSMRSILPLYKAAYQAELGALPSGTVSLIDVLDAYRRYLDESITTARLYRDLAHSGLKLDYLRNSYPGKKEKSQRSK